MKLTEGIQFGVSDTERLFELDRLFSKELDHGLSES